MRCIITIFILIIIFLLKPSFAQETQPGDSCATAGIVRETGGPEQTPIRRLICDGSEWKSVLESSVNGRTLLQIDFDSSDCDENKAGRLRYDVVNNTWEYCDGGAQWLPFERSGACQAPVICSTIGDVCDDSNPATTNDPIFAGFMFYSVTETCEALFVSSSNQSASSRWKNPNNGVVDIPTSSLQDGRHNSSLIPNSTTFPAFKICKDLNDGDFSDWYLPSAEELHLVITNLDAINANAVAPILGTDYWTSSESSNYNSYSYNVSERYFNNFGDKSYGYDVRCVRRN